MKKNWPDHLRATTVSAFVAALWATAPPAHALTLGRAVIQSPLGESMRAEIEFENLSPEEAESLRINVASAEIYRLSGVDYNPSLSGARVVLQRLANRRASLRITTERAIQEPFLELILELNWRGGRLVRSYTLLFDLPPSTRTITTPPALAAAPQMAAPITGPGLRPRISRRSEDVEQAELAEPSRKPPAAAAARRGPPPPGAPPAPPSVADPYRVRPGDTLSELAQRGARPAGVSLDRLVLAMFRENPDAFLGGNMNRLRNGVVLSAPSARMVDSITDAEARQVIRAQSADFNGYRSQLAAMPADRTETNARRASGKIQAAVEDRKQSAAGTPDKLTLSKPSPVSAAEADKASKERARQDAATRVAELSKNVQDLGRLSGAAAPPVVAPPLVAPPAPSPAPAPAPAPQMASAPGLTAPASPPVSAMAASAATPMVPASAAASVGSSPVVAPASAPRARPPVKPAPPPSEPDLMDSLLQDNLPAVGLAAALIAALGIFGVLRLLKRRRAAAPETSFLESRLKPDSFFGASGGQRIDTREVAGSGTSSSMMNYSLSQLDSIGDVDPVAEADVYLAYGRDLQAEEILKEAMRTTPERLAIQTKLLEVYAKRRDVKGFEQLASQLHAVTGGDGEDWVKARDLGRQIDPDNPLYGAEGAEVMATQPRYAEDSALGPATLPQSGPPSFRQTDIPTESAPNSSFDLDLDLDLGMDNVPSQNTVPIDTGATVYSPAAALPAPPPTPGAVSEAGYTPRADEMLNFVTPTGFGQLSGNLPASPVVSPVPASPRPPPPPAENNPFTPSAFALDLDLPEPSDLSPGPSMLPPNEGYGTDPRAEPEPAIDSGDPLARKLELADEFRQIGDLEGARDLLQEVVDRADGALKAKAEAMLASLS